LLEPKLNRRHAAPLYGPTNLEQVSVAQQGVVGHEHQPQQRS
jgi:hypothetical protein